MPKRHTTHEHKVSGQNQTRHSHFLRLEQKSYYQCNNHVYSIRYVISHWVNSKFNQMKQEKFIKLLIGTRIVNF